KGAAAPKRPGTSVLESAPEPAVVRREDYIAPAGAADKVPVLDKSKKKGTNGEPSRPAPPKPAAKPPIASVKLAPLPSVQQPPTEQVSQDPAQQKPDLKLPADALRAGRAGSKPLSEHLRKHEQRRKDSHEEPSRGGKKEETPMGLPGRERHRRGA